MKFTKETFERKLSRAELEKVRDHWLKLSAIEAIGFWRCMSACHCPKPVENSNLVAFHGLPGVKQRLIECIADPEFRNRMDQGMEEPDFDLLTFEIN